MNDEWPIYEWVFIIHNSSFIACRFHPSLALQALIPLTISNSIPPGARGKCIPQRIDHDRRYDGVANGASNGQTPKETLSATSPLGRQSIRQLHEAAVNRSQPP